MATRMSRVLAGSLRGRLYSTQAVRKQESQKSEVTTGSAKGVRFAVADNGGPVSRLTFIVKAGARYENSTNLGVTHLIRHITHLSTKENSTLKTLKELEISGGNVTSSSTRDYALVSLRCTRDQFSSVFGLCAPAITRSVLNDWDITEFNPRDRIRTDLGFLHNQPNVELLDILHGAAFKGTLENSLFMSPRFIDSVSKQQVLDFMQTHYQPDRTVVAATNIEPEVVANHIQTMKFSQPPAQPVETKANYVGGERRLPVGGLESTYVAFATEGPSLSSPLLLSAAVLQNVMGLGRRVKYGTDSIGSKLAAAVQKATNSPFTVSGLNANYTDSGLIGFCVSASPAEIEKVLRAAFSCFAEFGKSGISDEDVQRGKAQLKANIVMELETGDGFINNLAQQAIGSDKIMSVNDIMKMVDNIQTTDVVNAAKKLASGKPTMASLGDLTNVPSLDQLLK